MMGELIPLLEKEGAKREPDRAKHKEMPRQKKWPRSEKAGRGGRSRLTLRNAF